MAVSDTQRRFSLSQPQTWPGALGRLLNCGSLSPEMVANALYRGILGREPDLGDLADRIGQLRSGRVLEHVIRNFIDSPEFRSRMVEAARLRTIEPARSRMVEFAFPSFELPDLTAAMPEMYRRETTGDLTTTIYTANTDADIQRMEGLIEQHRYYDAPGVWSPVIDLDKELTAAIVRGLGAKSCFELGCFTGPVLSVLADAGVDIAGADVSHTAFTFAYPNVRAAMLYGDLLDLDIRRRFDAIVCMDVLEHISPLRLARYVEKIESLLTDDGFVFINSPMYGHDAAFGTAFGAYLAEWLALGDANFWRHWPCDDRGWPQHGHLVWADVTWWARLFAAHGLVRDAAAETVIHHRLGGFFENTPARRSLFVLRRAQYPTSAKAAAALDATLAAMPNLPRPQG